MTTTTVWLVPADDETWVRADRVVWVHHRPDLGSGWRVEAGLAIPDSPVLKLCEGSTNDLGRRAAHAVVMEIAAHVGDPHGGLIDIHDESSVRRWLESRGIEITPPNVIRGMIGFTPFRPCLSLGRITSPPAAHGRG